MPVSSTASVLAASPFSPHSTPDDDPASEHMLAANSSAHDMDSDDHASDTSDSLGVQAASPSKPNQGDSSPPSDSTGMSDSSSPETVTTDDTADSEPATNGHTSKADERRRVKVYLLENEEWLDRGTGFIDLPVSLSHGGHILKVTSELDPNESIIEFLIRREIQYQRQEGTLIVWTEPDNSDWAVSFALAEGCDEVWGLIDVINDHSPFDSSNSDDMLDDSSPPIMTPSRGLSLLTTLPEPTVGNLAEIRLIVQRLSRSRAGQERMSNYILATRYVDKLGVIFQSLEDLEAVDDLEVMFNIMKIIALSGVAPLYNDLVDDRIFHHVLGMLEYDRTIGNLPHTYRRHFESAATFRPVLTCLSQLPPGMNPSTTPTFQTLATRAYRLAYLKDVALARHLEDPAFNVLQDTLRQLHAAILRRVMSTPGFAAELGEVLSSDHTNATRRRHATLLLKELTSITKLCGDIRTQDVYAMLLDGGTIIRGLTDVICVAGGTGPGGHGHSPADTDTVRAACEFLAGATELQRPLVQRACLAQFRSTGTSPVHVLYTRMAGETDGAVLQACYDALKALLDPEMVPNPTGGMCEAGMNMVAHLTPEYDGFQAMYFASVAGEIPKVIGDTVGKGTCTAAFAKGVSPPGVQVLQLPPHTVERTYQLLELWASLLKINATRFADVVFHGRAPVCQGTTFALAGSGSSTSSIAAARAGSVTPKQGVSLDWLRLLVTCAHKHVQLSAIRLVRSLAHQPSDVFRETVVKHGLLPSVVQALLLTEGRYNLINSSALEVLDSILEHVRPGRVAAAVGPAQFVAHVNLRMLAGTVMAPLRQVAQHLAYVPGMLEAIGLKVLPGGKIVEQELMDRDDEDGTPPLMDTSMADADTDHVADARLGSRRSRSGSGDVEMDDAEPLLPSSSSPQVHRPAHSTPFRPEVDSEPDSHRRRCPRRLHRLRTLHLATRLFHHQTRSRRSPTCPLNKLCRKSSRRSRSSDTRKTTKKTRTNFCAGHQPLAKVTWRCRCEWRTWVGCAVKDAVQAAATCARVAQSKAVCGVGDSAQQSPWCKAIVCVFVPQFGIGWVHGTAAAAKNKQEGQASSSTSSSSST
ncbi:component of IIS longevity pathway SMK-1-domain-containing protein [Catenaria anguillulae PL171]|uniref:Component of IIS longevity pathway SMK-1-domain-containing protein n=1 Tax=Catenaria anguillulae PL171 TaxID=765915 RepID=A0A1Y2HHQ8_9FUNG|nr:component of IIS longevity pathway SMK-1-domain-containing protein [Catenaria anguillulae PL171]